MPDQTPKKPLSRRLLRRLLLVLVWLGLMSVPFFICEWVVREFIPQPIMPRYVESAPWGVRKNLADIRGRHYSSEFDVRVATNSQGFRGTREFSPTPKPGVLRVLVLGDSVSFGYGVNEEETYAARLERLLNLAHLNAEVLNLSVSGFGTAEELLQYQAVGAALKPDLVILGYFSNDPMNNRISQLFAQKDGQLTRLPQVFAPGMAIRDNLDRLPFYTFLVEHSHLVTFIRTKASAKILAYYQNKTRAPGSPPPAPFDPLAPPSATKDEFDLTRSLLLAFEAAVEKSGARLIVLNIPEKKGDLFPAAVPFGPQTRLVNLWKDLAPEVKAGARVFFPYDGHPTVYGHELIAEAAFPYVYLSAISAPPRSQGPSDSPK